MIVADFHVHSTFSVDGMSTMEQHCINLLSTRKIPFLSPVRFWIENIFMEDIIRVFRDKNLIESLGMNSCTVSRIIDDYRGKYEDVSNVWGVYVFLKWFEIHNT